MEILFGHMVKNIRLPSFFGAVCIFFFSSVTAEIQRLEKVAIPPKDSLVILYGFFTYTKSESPTGYLPESFPLRWAPTLSDDARALVGELKIEPALSIRASSSSTSSSDEDDEIIEEKNFGLQLTLVRYSDWQKRIDPLKFCDPRTESLAFEDGERVAADPNTFSINLRNFESFANEKHKPVIDKPVPLSGIYLLVLSNCSRAADDIARTLSVNVGMKNSYGYLPGTDIHKLNFFEVASYVHMGLFSLWVVLCVRWKNELFSIHYCILGIVFLSLLEAFLWCYYFVVFNGDGAKPQKLFLMAILGSSVKNVFSQILVLLACLGWGITQPHLPKTTKLKIQVLTVTYLILYTVREVVLSERHTMTFPLAFIMLCLLPCAMVTTVTIYWIFSAITEQLQTLVKARQTAKIELFENLWRVLIFATGLGFTCFLYQIYLFSGELEVTPSKWGMMWLLGDGVSHFIFIIILGAMMYLWAPNAKTQLYAYGMQLNQDEDFNADVLGVESGVDSRYINDIELGEGEFLEDAEKELNDLTLSTQVEQEGGITSRTAGEMIEEEDNTEPPIVLEDYNTESPIIIDEDDDQDS